MRRLLLGLVVACALVSGCAKKLEPNEETKQKIIQSLPPMAGDASDLHFVPSAKEGVLEFEFDGGQRSGTYDGKYVDFGPSKNDK